MYLVIVIHFALIASQAAIDEAVTAAVQVVKFQTKNELQVLATH
jgi:hypothetical protein